MAVVSIAGLGVSLPLAVVSMVSVAVAVTVSMAVVSIAGLGVSLPLAVVSMVSIAVAEVVAVAISMAVSMAVVAIAGLGNSHSKEGTGEGNQKFHVVCSSFSTELP